MMNKQILAFSVDTKAFYSDDENIINEKVFYLKNTLKLIEKYEKLKYLISKDLIPESKQSKFHSEFVKWLDSIDAIGYIEQYNEFKNLNSLEQNIYSFHILLVKSELIEKYNKYFRYVNKLLKENKYSFSNNKKIKYSKYKEFKALLNSNVYNISFEGEYKELTYKDWSKMYTQFKKQQNELLENNIGITRELNKSVLYNTDKDGNDIPKSYKQVSLFDSYLSDVLGIKENTLTTDIIIVRVYHYDVLDSLINNNFTFLGKEYIILGASSGQIRTKKAVFISKEVLEKYENTLTCGLSKDTINNSNEHGCNITKWLAYMSLINGATDKWEDFDINKAIVLDDWETIIEDEIDYIETKTINKPVLERVKLSPEEYKIEKQLSKKAGKKRFKRTKTIKVESDEIILAITDKPKRTKMKVPVCHSDGCGWILSSESNKSFQFRLPWMKGLLVSCDYISYIDEYCGGNDEVTDIWGKVWHLKKDDIKYVFFKSQFKMWKYYPNCYKADGTIVKYGWKIYKECYKKYNCHARKCNEEKDIYPDKPLSYQMVQTLTKFEPKDVEEVTCDTVEYIKNAYSNIESMLDIMGCHKEKLSYLQQALLIYPELLKDKAIFENLKSCISAKKKDAKFGKIIVPGAKYTFLAPDVLGWFNYVFKCDKNNDKILQKNECYCKLFRTSKTLAILRSPQLYREWGIAENKAYKKETDLQKKYYNTNCIYTSSLSLISKLLAFDNDGDNALCVPSEKWIELGKNNMKGIVPLYYEMGKAAPEEINNRNIYKGMVSAYKYNNIGMYSNLLTSGWNSKYRDNLDILGTICAINNFSIDAAKTLQMIHIENEELKTMFKEIDKLDMPYFFQFAKDKDVEILEDRNDSFVNKICARIENIEKDIQEQANKRYNKPEGKNTKQLFNTSFFERFDYRKLMNNKKIKIDERLIKFYNELNKEKNTKFLKSKSDSEENSYYAVILEYRNIIFDWCKTNKIKITDATDILVKYLYTNEQEKKKHKTLLWEVFGKYIVDNLKKNVEKNKVVPDGYFRCRCCNGVFKKKSETQIICTKCENKLLLEECDKIITQEIDRNFKIEKIKNIKFN